MNQFVIRQFDQKTLSWWRNHRKEIDMNPPYQRKGRLWSASDKAYLIDSILNGFDIPKVYIADFTWGRSKLNIKKLPFAIVDGKQRFEAIFDFFDGNIVLNSDFEYRKNPSLTLRGLGYRDILNSYPDIAEDLENFNLHVMSIYTDDESMINDLFVRLNRSKPLTGAEIRNAMGGPVPVLIRSIASHSFFKETANFPMNRGQDQNAAAKILLFEYSDQPRDTKKGVLDKFVIDARSSAESATKLKLATRNVIDNLVEMENVFLPSDTLLGSAGTIPVYYWVIRTLDESERVVFREFLSYFEDLRKLNRSKLKDNPDDASIDSRLIEYDNYNRSTNDLQSHEGRIRIIRQMFSQWRNTSPPH